MTLTLGGERIASPRYSENVAGLIPGSLVGETFLIGKGLKFHPCRFEESFQQLERLMSTVAQQLTSDSDAKICAIFLTIQTSHQVGKVPAASPEGPSSSTQTSSVEQGARKEPLGTVRR